MQGILMADAFRATLLGVADHLVAAFAAFSHSAAPSAVTALWQSIAVAVVLAFCLRLAPRISAAHRFVVWAAGFAIVVALPLLPWLLPVTQAGAAVAAPFGSETPRHLLQLDSRWGFLIAALWLVMSTFRTAQLGGHLVRLHTLLKTAVPVHADEKLHVLFDRTSSARRSIAICTTRELDRPCVVGFFAPRILIPEWLFERLTPMELDQVVLHETEHLRRRDDWSNLAQKLALIVFPLNPALAWMERRLCREREMACDEGVVRRTREPRAYAACLTSVAERGLERRDLLRHAHALSLGAFERRPELVCRVHSILWNRRVLNPVAARFVVGAVSCGLLLGMVELARSPQVVSFVTAPKAEAQTVASTTSPASPSSAGIVQSTGGKLTRAASGFRVIEAKAVLTASHVARAPISAPAPGRNTAQRTAEEDVDVAPTSGTPSPALVATRTAASVAAPAPEQQIVVFTTWEETRTTRIGSRPVADYDTDASSNSQTAGSLHAPGDEPDAQITVTRLIFAVVSASAAPAASVPSVKPPHATGSPSSRSPALPIDKGWLMFEL